MTDEILMLDEDETLALLRAGRTGTEPPLTDVSAIAITRGRRRRARRRAGQSAGALVLAAAAAVAVVSGAPGLTRGAQPVVQPADRGTEGTSVVTGAEVDVRNQQLLAAALGPDFRVRLSGTNPRFAEVELIPGSPADTRLPDGYEVYTELEIAPGFTQRDDPCNPDDAAAATGTCEHRALDDGGEVLISSLRSAQEEDYFAAAYNAYFVRPDGQVVRMTLRAAPADKDLTADAPTRTAVLAWLRSFTDGLASAATDPRISTPPVVAQTSEARYQDERNLAYLREALGQDWTPVKGQGKLAASESARSGLPSDYVGHARVMVSPGIPIEEICPQTQQKDSTCDLRTLADGRQVVVQSTPVWYLKPGELYTAYSSFSIGYVQPDTGSWVTVTVSAHGVDVTAEEPAAIREQVMAWLAGCEDLLTRAATDPRMAVDTEDH